MVSKLKLKKQDDIFQNVKRCTKCVLPETFPGISYNEEGICNYCLEWKPVSVLGELKLNSILDSVKNKGDRYDILVPFSGGRDSTFVLYELVKKYSMRVLAITVDSGFLTKEGYDNISRVSDCLNVDHVWLKDENKIKISKKNCITKFHGWLKNPSINTIVPVLNSGDKTMNLQMYKYAHQHHIPLMTGGNIIGNSVFEHEHWKTGYLGVFPDNRGIYSTTDKIKLSFLFWKEYLSNSDNLKIPILTEYSKGAAVYFFESVLKPSDVDNFGFFDYIHWKEEEILTTIRHKANWKGADDTETTWRIDDAAYPLINYIYWKLVGFTEHDEMYSKMIRDNQITRKEALNRLTEDQTPRLNSIEESLLELNVDKKSLDKVLDNYRKKLLRSILN